MSKLKNILLLIVSLALCLLVLEGVARLLVDFDANYYAAPEIAEKGTIHRHPYGEIPVNSEGYFDAEFVDDERQAIGYFGDSVTYGVGAGFPHRFTEHLDRLRPEFHHLNVGGGIGSSLADFNFGRLEALRDNFNLGTIVYVMNLNDILPVHLAGKRREAKKESPQGKPKSERPAGDNLRWLIRWRDRLDVLRGTSVLYTWARNVAKTYLMQQGFDAQGYRSIEQFPEKNREIISSAADAINEWGARVREKGIKPCVAILPYEMQISEDAARVYRELDIKFSHEFRSFGTQRIISEGITDVPALVLGKSFPEKPVGTYFVYNLGDRIDFNHPNRAGHELIGKEISDSRFCF